MPQNPYDARNATLGSLIGGPQPDYGYGARWNEPAKAYSGAPKGLGFLGPLKLPNGGITSEFSMGVNIGGKEVEIPTFVPTLSKPEVQLLMHVAEKGGAIPKEIVQKAIAHATQRINAGLDPFAQLGEQQMLHPDIPRQWPEPDVLQPGTLGSIARWAR